MACGTGGVGSKTLAGFNQPGRPLSEGHLNTGRAIFFKTLKFDAPTLAEWLMKLGNLSAKFNWLYTVLCSTYGRISTLQGAPPKPPPSAGPIKQPLLAKGPVTLFPGGKDWYASR